MDIIFNLVLVGVVIFLFFLLRYSENPYLYVGIIMFSITGLVISVSSPLYLEIGVNETYTYNQNTSPSESVQIKNIITEPIKQDLDMYNYIFQLFYLMTMIGGVIYWSLSTARTEVD